MVLNNYKEFVNRRFMELVTLTGLPILYIESGTGITASNLYNIMKGNREASVGIIEKLGNLLGLPLIRIFDPGCDLNDYVQKSVDLEELLRIVAQLNEDSISVAKFIQMNLLDTPLFNEPVSVAEVRNKCPKPESKEFNSHNVATALDSLVNKGVLKVTKMPIIKEDGSRGVRLVKYYSRPKFKKTI